MDWLNKWVEKAAPYARRAIRVFLYAAIPVVAQWVIDSDPVTLEIGLRVAGAAGILALLDKKRMAG